MSAILERAAAWLLAYAIHSTLLLGAAALVTARLRDHGWRDALWRAALVGGVLTVTVQALAGHTPSLGGWSPAAAVRAAPSADLEATASPMTTARSADAPTASPSLAAASATTGDRAAAGGKLVSSGGSTSDGLASGDAVVSQDGVGSNEGRTSSDSRAAGDRLASREGAASGGGFAPRSLASVDWSLVALGAWALGAMLLLMRLVVRQVALHRMLGPRAPVDDPQLAEALSGLCSAAGLRRAPRLTQSERCPTPLALGMGEICIPRRFRELPAEERRAALAHELAHVARRDPLWHLGAGIAEALFFFQPLQSVARRSLRESAEYLSDDWAVRQTGSPLGLARCLVEVAAWLKGSDPVPQGVLAMAEGGPVLSRRVERLVRQDSPAAPLSPVRRIAAALLLLVPVAALAPGAARSAVAASSPGVMEALGALGPMRQEPRIVRHPDSSRPLAERIDWAMEQARGRRAWFGWATAAVPDLGVTTVLDTEGLDLAELDRTPALTQLFGFPGGEAVILFRVDRAGRVERISTRLGRGGMSFGGAPVYWLGSAPGAQSVAWLVDRERREPVERIRRGLVETIGLHAETQRVLPLLAERLAGDRSAEIRAAAAEAMERHPSPESLRRLLFAVANDADPHVRMEATEAMGNMDLPAAREALRRLIRESPDEDVRREAVESLSDGPGGVDPVELERLAFSDDHAVAREATETLQNLPSMDALPSLVRIAWNSPAGEVRRQAAETLGYLKNLAGLPALDSILARHPDEDVQRQAVEAISNLSADVSLPRLRRLASTHPSEAVREEARDRLGNR